MTAVAERLTAPRALELMAAEVAKMPHGYRYQVHPGHQICFNVFDGKCDCLIGRALVSGGIITIAELLAKEDERRDPLMPPGSSNVGVVGIYTWWPERFEPAAVAVMRLAQRRQDEQVPWAACLHEARAVWAEMEASPESHRRVLIDAYLDE